MEATIRYEINRRLICCQSTANSKLVCFKIVQPLSDGRTVSFNIIHLHSIIAYNTYIVYLRFPLRELAYEICLGYLAQHSVSSPWHPALLDVAIKHDRIISHIKDISSKIDKLD